MAENVWPSTHTVQLAQPTLRFVSGPPGRAITIVTKARVVQSMHEVRDGGRTPTRAKKSISSELILFFWRGSAIDMQAGVWRFSSY